MKERTFENVLPRQYFNEDFSPVDNSELAKAVMSDWYKYFSTPQGRKLKNDIRGKIFTFVETSGNIREGRTNVNTMGNYLIGTAPKSNSNTKSLASRTVGEQFYAQACVEAFNAYAKDTGFKLNKDNDYTSRSAALMAIEADSISSKGPYDNAFDDTALKTVVHVLENHLNSKSIPENYFRVAMEGVYRRFEEYRRYTNKDYTIDVSKYVEYMQSQGLKRTMRGFPFGASGDAKMKDYWHQATVFMFRNTPVHISEIEWENAITETLENGTTRKRNLTVDEYIQAVLVKIHEQHLTITDWFTLDQVIIFPISRNQGSPFKTEQQDSGVRLTHERKDMKYRLVTPIAAFVQAYSILATGDLVHSAKFTIGRTGLLDPESNKQGMNKFIQKAHERSKVIISTDFDAYDSTLPGQLMAMHGNMYTYLYDSPLVKDGIICATLSLVHKLMFLPCYTTDEGRPYKHYTRMLFKNIKGIRSFADKAIANRALFKSDVIEQSKLERFDYIVCCFYIYQGYLCSGHILTNATGSDNTLLLSRSLVAYAIFLRYAATFKWRSFDDVMAIASGDDCCQEVPLELYESLGLDGIYGLLQEVYLLFSMIVKAAKQVKVKYKGLPIVDFLQHPYIQGEDSATTQPTYNKFMRQVTCLPYTERRSKLPVILQWEIVLGKGESAVCEENVEMASYILSYIGEYLHQVAKKKRYKPQVHQGLQARDGSLDYNSKYSIFESRFAGLEQLLGLVKSYKQDTVSAMGKYASGHYLDVISVLDTELETKAPHRAGLVYAIYKSLGDKAYQFSGGDQRFEGFKPQTHFYFVEALEKWLNFDDVDVPAVVLDEPIQGAADVGSDLAESDDDPDDYEFDEGPTD